MRLDAACDTDGRIVLLHAVPVWQHAEHGTVRGTELWTVAERQGRAAALQRWLLRQACLEVAGLDDDRIGVAVSLPAGHVTPDGLADEVAEALAGAGLHPSRLTLSFTEETLLTSSAALVPELEAARATGVRLCLDNYGMGHSLFALLARISLDMVRVDLAALATRDDTGRALQVLSAIVRTTASFDLITIAGGVSSPEVRRVGAGRRRRAAARPAPAARPAGRGGRGAAARRGPGPRRLTLSLQLIIGCVLVYPACPPVSRPRQPMINSGGVRVHPHFRGGIPHKGANSWELSPPRRILARVASPELHFLGHSTVRVELAGRTVLTDPLLAPTVGLLRRVVPLPDRAAWAGVDLVLISHLHGDHLHIPSLRTLGTRRPDPGAPRRRRLAARPRLPERRRAVGRRDRSRTATCASPPSAPSTAATAGARAPPTARPPSRSATCSRATDPRSTPAATPGSSTAWPCSPSGRSTSRCCRCGAGVPRSARGTSTRSAPPTPSRLIRPRFAVPVHWGTLTLAGMTARPSPMRSRMRRLLVDPPRAFAAEVAARGVGTRVVVTEPGHPVVLDPRGGGMTTDLLAAVSYDAASLGYPLLFGLVLLGSVDPDRAHRPGRRVRGRPGHHDRPPRAAGGADPGHPRRVRR